jgi:hypothetical protein
MGYTDRIPWVLVNIYFCRGLSGNDQRRPTCKIYIERKTSRTRILYKTPEDTKPDRRAVGHVGRAPALSIWAPAHLRGPIRSSLADPAPTVFEDKSTLCIKVGLIWRPWCIWGGYINSPRPQGFIHWSIHSVDWEVSLERITPPSYTRRIRSRLSNVIARERGGRVGLLLKVPDLVLEA